MEADECIYEIHFSTSYTQLLIMEEDDEGNQFGNVIICEAIGTKPSPLDMIAVSDSDWGEFVWP